MRDPRLARLAEILLDHSCAIKPREKVLIEAFDLPDPAFVNELIRAACERDAVPLVTWKNLSILRSLYKHAGKEAFAIAGKHEKARMEEMDAYIGVRGASNSNEYADVPHEQMDLQMEHWGKPVHFDVRIRKTKWVVLRYPTPSMAQSARMSSEAFEDFYFDVCTTDYAKMARDQEPLRRRMDAADRVRIVGPGTNIEFSIKGIPVIPCNGQHNIPDGEVFTAPVRDSVNGTIRFNVPSLYQGTAFDGVQLRFEGGQIVNASCVNEPEKLNQILDSDDGARFVGEWSIGCNNRVRQPILDTLFDEKIGGSIHLTPGNAYEEADNGNRSRVHWDLVLIQTPEHGGGEIYFDDEIIRRDGRFIPDDLKALNAGL